jgi:hypothetical protein
VKAAGRLERYIDAPSYTFGRALCDVHAFGYVEERFVYGYYVSDGGNQIHGHAYGVASQRFFVAQGDGCAVG